MKRKRILIPLIIIVSLSILYFILRNTAVSHVDKDLDEFFAYVHRCKEKSYIEDFLDFSYRTEIYYIYGFTRPFDLLPNLATDTSFKVRVFSSNNKQNKKDDEYEIHYNRKIVTKTDTYTPDDVVVIYGDGLSNEKTSDFDANDLNKVLKTNDTILIEKQHNYLKWFSCSMHAFISEKKVYANNQLKKRYIKINKMAGTEIINLKQSFVYNDNHQLEIIKSLLKKRKGFWDYLLLNFSFAELPIFVKIKEIFIREQGVISNYKLTFFGNVMWEMNRSTESFDFTYYE